MSIYETELQNYFFKRWQKEWWLKLIDSIKLDKYMWYFVYKNENATMNLFLSGRFPLNFKAMSENPNLTVEIIEKYNEANWCWNLIFSNPNIPIDYLLSRQSVNYNNLSEHPKIRIQHVLNDINKQWNWEYLSKTLPINDIKKHPKFNKKWSWCEDGLSENPTLTIDFILKYPNKNWCWNCISRHQNITMDIIAKNPNMNWNYLYVSKNPNVTVDFVLNNLNELWDWYNLSNNPNITKNMKDAHKNLPWYTASMWYENLTTEQTLQIIPKITLDFTSIYFIVEATFKHDKTEYINQQMKKILLASIMEKYEQADFCTNMDTVDFVLSNGYLVNALIKF